MTDGAGLLPPAALARLESQLADFERETTHQIAVLSVPSLHGEPIEAFALRVAERVELGQRGLDNGILLVVAAEERRARVEVGYGLEGVVPDAVAKRVLEDTILPRFRAGDFAGGIEAGVEALMRAARGEVVPDDRRGLAVGRTDPLVAVFFGVISSWLLWLPLRRRRVRVLRALLSGATSGVLGWLLLASLGWAAIGASIGLLLGWLDLGRDVLFTTPRRGRGWSAGGWSSDGRGGGSGGFGGGGFSGGGGRFGGGGASGGW